MSDSVRTDFQGLVDNPALLAILESSARLSKPTVCRLVRPREANSQQPLRLTKLCTDGASPACPQALDFVRFSLDGFWCPKTKNARTYYRILCGVASGLQMSMMTPRSPKPATQKHDPRGPSQERARATSQQTLSVPSLNATESDARIVTQRRRSGVWRRIGYSSTTSIPLLSAESTRHRISVCFASITIIGVSRRGTGIGRAIHSRRPVHDPRLGQKERAPRDSEAADSQNG